MNIDNLDIIVKMEFGSKLYGTDSPLSDLDYKGVFLPTVEQVLLNRIPKSVSFTTKSGNDSRNTSEDIDIEIYSLHYFLKLACEGQTVAIDMLHADNRVIVQTSTVWESIRSERKRFHTKNLQAFVGYARRQASKYGIKGSRLNDAKKVLDFLFPHYRNYIKLSNIWDQLPEGDHLHKIGKDANGKEQYQICGKIVQETVTTRYAYDMVDKFYKEYGKRAEQAAKNEGIDWKAVSHALRAAYQVKQLLTEGDITFPLKEAEFLKEVKAGNLDYSTVVAPLLDSLMDEVEELASKSTLPEKVDRKWWDQWLIKTLKQKMYQEMNPYAHLNF